MRKLDVSAITDNSQFPVKQGTLQFLQDANSELFSAIIISLIGANYNPNTIYVLFGCQNTGIPPFYNISAGAVFYNGEIFYVNAATFSVSSGNTAVFSQITTQYQINADPVTFSDGAIRNVHNIRMMQISQGAPGSGISNYLQAFFLSFAIPMPLDPTTLGDGNVLQISGAYPNFNFFVPTPPTSPNPILTAGTFHIGDVTGSGPYVAEDYNIVFNAPINTGNYYVMHCLISNGVPINDSSVIITVRNRTTTGFTINARETGANTQNLDFDYIIFAK